MKIDFNALNIGIEIKNYIASASNEIISKEPEMLKKSAEIIKKNVVKNLPRSEPMELRSNYDGSRPYIHMQDDVRVSMHKSKYGNNYAKISGGKFTGYKWHMLNDGTIDQRGKIHTKATHFVETSTRESEQEMDTAVEKVIERAFHND